MKGSLKKFMKMLLFF